MHPNTMRKNFIPKAVIYARVKAGAIEQLLNRTKQLHDGIGASHRSNYSREIIYEDIRNTDDLVRMF
jgi:hypothetical protein